MRVEYKVSPHGDVDIAAVPELRRQWLELIDHHHPDRLVIDLSDVSFLDCRGIGLIVATYKRQRARGASLAIVNPGPSARRILTMTGVDALVEDQALPRAGDRPAQVPAHVQHCG